MVAEKASSLSLCRIDRDLLKLDALKCNRLLRQVRPGWRRRGDELARLYSRKLAIYLDADYYRACRALITLTVVTGGTGGWRRCNYSRWAGAGERCVISATGDEVATGRRGLKILCDAIKRQSVMKLAGASRRNVAATCRKQFRRWLSGYLRNDN